TILRVPGHRPVEQELIERELPLKDVTFRQTDLALDIDGRADFRVQDQVPEIGAVPRNSIDHGVAERLAARVIPLAIRQLIGTILYKYRHVVFTIRRHGRIDL